MFRDELSKQFNCSSPSFCLIKDNTYFLNLVSYAILSNDQNFCHVSLYLEEVARHPQMEYLWKNTYEITY